MTPADRTDRRVRALYFSLVALLCAGFLVRQRLHGLAFPPPWPDEGSFLWQALALKERGTLFAPEVHPARAVLWMPPGYMVLSGAIFSVTGFSLEWARTLSGLYLCFAVVCVAALIQPLRGRFGYLALLLVFMQSPIAMLAGNTARMESLVLLVSAASFLLLERGHRAAGLSLLAIGPLIHPNALFALLGGALYCFTPLRGSLAQLRPRRPELVLIGFAALAWLAYVAYTAAHWQDFVQDIGFQLRWKQMEAGGEDGRLKRLLWPGAWAAALCMVAAFRAARSTRPLKAIFMWCVALWLQALLVVGWLYELYALFMLVLAAILGAEAIAVWLGPRFGARIDAIDGSTAASVPVRGVRAFAAGHFGSLFAFGLALFGALFVVRSEFFMRSVTHAVTALWPGPPRYMRAEDRSAIARYLKELSSLGGSVTVNFMPESEALEFYELRGPSLRFCQQTFQFQRADVFIFHESVWIPPFVRSLTIAKLAFQHGIALPVENWQVLRARDGTESWRVYRRPP